jgi:anti-sigma factor RsiW
MAHDFSDETVMAYADGAASAEAARAIEAAMAKDSKLASRVEMFRATHRIAKAAMSGPEREPVPDTLRTAIEKQLRAAQPYGKVVAFRPPNAAPVRHYLLPMAASIATLAAGLAGYVLGLGAGSPSAGNSMIVLDVENWSAEVAILNEASSGDSVAIPGARIDMIASFRDADDRFCREFELDRNGQSAVVSVACRSGQDWEVTFAVAAASTNEGYAPATSRNALNAYLDAVGANEPMSHEEERQSLNPASK